MRIDAIEIHTGQPDFPFEPIRQLEAKCEATTLYNAASTIETANAKLRQLAAGIGADAIIEVKYDSGMSLTSWKSMKATGLAVRKVADSYPCPNCAETIKRAARQCRFCGAALEPSRARQVVPSAATVPQAEPLKSNDNKAGSTIMIIFAILVGLTMFFGIANS